MTNYSNGKIYKIEPLNGEDGDVYIGSTTKEYLSQRMTAHRTTYKCFLNGKYGKLTSFKLFEKYGIDNCKIILLELVNANSKDELLAREAHYIKSVACVNKVVPLQTHKEYCEANKDAILIQKKEYKKENKEAISEYQKEYRIANKDAIKKHNEANMDIRSEYLKKYRIANKDAIKERYEANKDAILFLKKEYYETNKDAINQRRREARKLKKQQITV